MLKKAKAEARADTSSAKDRAQSMLDSSRQIWLAGLGAFARAKGEGAKVFDTLVKQGQSLEGARSPAAPTAAAARDAAAEGAARVQTMAGDTWDKLEQVFEDRVARALSRLGVHTQSDVEQLSERVDAWPGPSTTSSSPGRPPRGAAHARRRRSAPSTPREAATPAAKGGADVGGAVPREPPARACAPRARRRRRAGEAVAWCASPRASADHRAVVRGSRPRGRARRRLAIRGSGSRPA